MSYSFEYVFSLNISMPQVICHFPVDKTSYLCPYQDEEVCDIIPDANTGETYLLHGGHEFVSGATPTLSLPYTIYHSLSLSSPRSGLSLIFETVHHCTL